MTKEEDKVLKFPELIESSYAEDVDDAIKDAHGRMKEDEDRAKRRVQSSLIGDMANLAVNIGSAALGGNTQKQEMAAEAASKRLREIRERNAGQIMDYALRRAKAKEEQRIQNNKDIIAKYNAEVADEQNRLENDRKDRIAASQIEKNKSYSDYYKNKGGDNRTTSEKRTVSYNGRNFSLNKDEDYLVIYAAMKNNGLPGVQKRGDVEVNGEWVVDNVPDDNASMLKIKQYVEDVLGRENKPTGWKDDVREVIEIDEDFE